MNFFDKIFNWMFSGLIHRHLQRTRQHAALALALWERHCDGKPPESPEAVREAAECVLEEDARVGIDNSQTETARLVMQLLEK